MNFQEQAALKQKSNITLKEPLTLDELYALMTERWDTQKYGNFKLEKFLFFKSIRLDNYLMMKFEIQITGIAGQGKNLVVCVTRIEANQSPNKAQREQIKAIGGREASRVAELKRWESLIDAMWEVLRDKVAEKQLF